MSNVQGWTPDATIGRAECTIACSVRTLYRQFEKNLIDIEDAFDEQQTQKTTGYNNL